MPRKSAKYAMKMICFFPDQVSLYTPSLIQIILVLFDIPIRCIPFDFLYLFYVSKHKKISNNWENGRAVYIVVVHI